ncbi:MAG: DUF3883 domain-containing protein, partial [Acidiphilium sp.]|nr:DUF3883 domain-containing protein [Acidiphilium sp.]
YPWITDGGEGQEAFNFLPDSKNRYYGYVPPQGAYAGSPHDRKNEPWTVVFLARNGKQTGLYIVGWYEDARLVGKKADGSQYTRPEYDDGTGFRLDTKGVKFSYSIYSDKAFLVLPEYRSDPLSHPSIKQASYSYVLRPDEKQPSTEAKRTIFKEINRRLTALRANVISQPDRRNVISDIEENETDPLINFGTAEQRKAVEMAAEDAVTTYLQEQGYVVTRRSDEKIGYDLHAKHKRHRDELYVEVKGTSGAVPRFFITPNERAFMTTNEWRFALVTGAIHKPSIEFLNRTEFEKRFDLLPGVWIGKLKAGQ